MKTSSTMTVLATALLLVGCGAAETAGVAAAQAEMAADDAKEAKEKMAKIEADLDAAQQTAADAREAAEAASQ